MTAAELAEKLEISPATLRKWEQHFAPVLLPGYKLKKNYTASALQQFAAIKYLIEERGFTPDGALKEIQRQESLDSEQSDLIDKLYSLRQFLEELKESLG